MTRVLLVCEYPSLHGGERSMLATLAGLRRAGFSIAVMGPPEGPLAEAVRSQDLEVVPFEFRDTAGRRLPQDRLRSRLARQIERRSPELLHANSLAMGRLCGPVAADLKLPSIAHLRDIVRLSRRAVADLNRNTRLLAVSRATREFHVAAGVSAAKTHVVYNGVDLARFRPRPPTGYLHRELGLPPGTPLVGTIGQICLRKGQDALLKAAVLLTGELPEVHYVIVGRRWSEKAESRRFEADLHAVAGTPLAGRVHFLDVRDDVDRILNELVLLVHPARQEPLGRVLLEAAASGIAVLATDVGGTREIFPPRSAAARLVPPDAPPSLAAAIAELLSDGPGRRRLATAARRRAEEAFTASRAAADLVRHYGQTLSVSAEITCTNHLRGGTP